MHKTPMNDAEPRRISRRTLLTGATAAAATAVGAIAYGRPTRADEAAGSHPAANDHDTLLAELDDKIRAGMARYAIPGVAVGMLYHGQDYVRGYGVNDVGERVPVDGDTVFRIGSTTKTMTGTTIMRLVEQGRVHLDAPVHRYVPDLRTADHRVAGRVTVRQLLNHSAGWLGEYYQDFGTGDDALARYVAGIVRLRQLTAPGSVFAYNNAAVALGGRVIELTTGHTYENAVRKLLIDPLGMSHTRFFADELKKFTVATPHRVVDGKPVADPGLFAFPRSINSTGGAISSVRDQLRYAHFHLGDGTAPDGKRLLHKKTLTGMRSRPGPGGTLQLELDGIGVNWMLRPTVEGPRIVQHGGSWPGQYSGFLMVPERGFAFTVLTNSEGGAYFVNDLFTDDWALRRFAGVRNLPAEPRPLTERQLAAYQGRYATQVIGGDGAVQNIEIRLTADRGGLVLAVDGTPQLRLEFYRRDHVLVLNLDGTPTGLRADFLRGARGNVTWFRLRGRLNRRLDH